MKKRFMSQYGLSAYDAGVLTADKEFAEYYETAAKGGDPKMVNSWMTVELFGWLNKNGKELSQSPISAQSLGALVGLIVDGTINGKIAKDVFAKMIESGDEPATIVERDGLKQTTDTGAIEKAIDDLMATAPEKVAEAREKPKMLGWWVGQVMKSTGGKANPAIVNDILKKKLGIE